MVRNTKLPSAVTLAIGHLTPLSFSFFSAALKLSRPFEVLGQPIVADQAGGGELVLVVVEDDRVGIERHGVLLAVDVHGLPRRRREAGLAETHGLHVVGGDLGQRLLVDRARNARGVIGHHVRALADRGGGLDLGVERRAPVERRRLDLDRVLVLGVEVRRGASSCGRRRRRRGSPTRSPFPWPQPRRRSASMPSIAVASIVFMRICVSSHLHFHGASGAGNRYANSLWSAATEKPVRDRHPVRRPRHRRPFFSQRLSSAPKQRQPNRRYVSRVRIYKSGGRQPTLDPMGPVRPSVRGPP